MILTADALLSVSRLPFEKRTRKVKEDKHYTGHLCSPFGSVSVGPLARESDALPTALRGPRTLVLH